ncbi:MAG TPA: SgcJ/EcaC family oxidoreductase [Vicinamibacterales bacterium]|nr:SgcJ/EcaC family oxidoreductase [Vicinamibacterales bacterium]
MTRQFFWTAGLLLAVAAACAPPPAAPVDTAADVAAINALVEREIAAVSAGDMEAIWSIFAEDVISMPPNEPAVNGHAGIDAWMAAMMEQMTVSGGYTSSDVIVSGDLAVHRFTGELTLTPKAGGDAVTEAIKGLHVLRKQADGTWKITQDVWNTDRPAPAGGN